MHTPLSILQKYWQYQHFRPLQEEIIQQVLSGQDTLAVLPTGAGKSLCYQVPALLRDGVCIVVSPLIALMKDQVSGLKRRGIVCTAVYTGMRKEEVERVYRQVLSGKFKFLFLSPERLQSTLFLDYFAHWSVSLIAVDEAHCISQWGYDFRPPYLEIALIRESMPQVPVIALTASATPQVQTDIIEKLRFREYRVFFSTFARPNISISCLQVDNKLVKLLDIVQKVGGSKIVYCRNRKRTKEIAEWLIKHGLSADHYHAGLKEDQRNARQDAWLAGKTETIVCTNAFGMGIDKTDVRCVIHYDAPDTPEAYYQEIGRAGRDGKKAFAVLLFQYHDSENLLAGIDLKYPSKEKIKAVYQSLAYYFGIGIGSGSDEVFDFELSDFCKKFDHNIIEALSCVKMLEQQGFLHLSEGVFLPSTVNVVATKQALEQWKNEMPELGEVLTLLLRMYGGIWNDFIPVDEFLMAQKAGASDDYIHHQLRLLHQHGLIDYRERKSKPQITYLHNRVDLRFLQIDMQLLQVLKTRYTQRVNFMIGFINEQQTCRANKLIAYFGEMSTQPCRICDNCLAYKKTLQSDAFVSIKSNILHHISLHNHLSLESFCKQLNTTETEKIVKVIRFLLDEQILKINESGDFIRS